MIIDLRPFYARTTTFKKVARQDSFADWSLAIGTLESWNILLPETAAEFRALMPLRHQSIHFNLSTYKTLKDDALAAILHLRAIIDRQFGWGVRPWFIPNTKGHQFIKKEYEEHPFIKTYFVPYSPFVGPYFAIDFETGTTRFTDHPDYGSEPWTDEEFTANYNERTFDMLAKRGPSQPA